MIVTKMRGFGMNGIDVLTVLPSPTRYTTSVISTLSADESILIVI
jgi:hypothetical protein